MVPTVGSAGVLSKFDPVGFCDALKSNVLFVGDSITLGQYEILKVRRASLPSSLPPSFSPSPLLQAYSAPYYLTSEFLMFLQPRCAHAGAIGWG